MYGANVPLKPIIPELGEAFDITRYPYQDGGTMNVLLILCIFATVRIFFKPVSFADDLLQDHPEVDFCPYVPSLAATLCIFLPNNDVLGCLSSFVRQSGRNMWAYIPVGQKECHLFSLVFLELVRRNMPSFVKHLSRHNLSLPDWRFFWMRTFASLFLDVLRLPTTLRVIDALFLEGSKIFIRTGLGLLLSLEKPLLQCTNFAQMEKAIKTAGQSPDLDVDGVFSLGFRVPISRAEILQMRFRLLSQVDLQLRPIVAYQKPVPELSEPSLIVDPDMLQRLWSWMPQRFRIRNMELLFCTQQHGYSLQTLFKNNGDCEATIMFVKTTKGAVFGAFLTQSWMHRKPRHYFGTGESFLFSLVPEHTVYYWARIESVADGGGHVRFRAGSAVDRVPSFFQLAERDFLAIGGGAKGPGLWLDASLLKGKSNPSETFNNKPLHGSDDDEFFECAIVELYGIV